MPITITPSSPGGLVGPGLQVNLTSDFIGPLAQPAHFELDFLLSDNETLMLSKHKPTTTPFATVVPFVDATGESTTNYYVRPPDQATINLAARLYESQQGTGNPVLIDQSVGIKTAVWDPTTGQVPSTLQGTGGFTETDRTNLDLVAQSTVQESILDQLTLQELTNGPQGGFVGAQLPEAFWGVIVRLANVPPELAPQTPDGDYWIATLATVRIYRGSDLWMRVPVHTSTKIIPLYNEHIAATLPAIFASAWMLQMTLQVQFHPEATGQVFLMRFP